MVRLIALVALATLSIPIYAEEWVDFSPREAALGGTSAADERGVSGGWYNPGGASRRPLQKPFAERMEFDIPSGIALSIHGTAYRDIFGVIDSIVALEEAFDAGRFNQGSGTPTFDDLQGAFNILGSMSQLKQKPYEGIYVTASTGFGVQFREVFLYRDVLSFRGTAWTASSLTTGIDLDSINFMRFTDESGAAWQAMVDSAITANGGPLMPTTPEGQALAARLITMGYTADEANTLATMGERSGVDLSGEGGAALESVLSNTLTGFGQSLESQENMLDGNESAILMRSLVFHEFSAGYSAGIGDYLSLGGTIKYMRASWLTEAILLSEIDDAGTILDRTANRIEEAITLRNEDSKANIGIDLGLTVTPWSTLAISVSARNVNMPEFEFASDTIKLVSQVRAAASYTLFDKVLPLTFAVDMDLNRVESIVMPEYHTQFLRASVGFEPQWGIFGFGVRLGTFKNIGDANESWTGTAGFGLRLWAIRLDFGAQAAFEMVNFSVGGNEISLPQRLGAFMQVTIIADF
ncbi:MAG: conjugal transfer protein TraF [Planctomycetes bacterium]|nr:conjugal transfer protein TraF [Planctomycetota bacterium]